MNGGGSPCRRRSRCSARSCQTCAVAAGVGKGRKGGGQSSTSTESWSTAYSTWDLWRTLMEFQRHLCPWVPQCSSENHWMGRGLPVG